MLLAWVAKRTGDNRGYVGSLVFLGLAAGHALLVEAPPKALACGLESLPSATVAITLVVAGILLVRRLLADDVRARENGVLLLIAAVWLAVRGRREADPAKYEAYLGAMTSRVAEIFQVGLRDHVHCAVLRKYPKNPPPAAEMTRDLGAQYAALLPLIRQKMPAGARVIMAHRCTAAGRPYVHVVLRDGAALLSLVITRKNPGVAQSSSFATRRCGRAGAGPVELVPDGSMYAHAREGLLRRSVSPMRAAGKCRGVRRRSVRRRSAAACECSTAAAAAPPLSHWSTAGPQRKSSIA